MAVTRALLLTAAHGWRYALIMFNNDYNLNLTILPPTFQLPLPCLYASLCKFIHGAKQQINQIPNGYGKGLRAD